jgi:hypothetical protein
MNLYFLTIFVPIVELTRGKRSSRWRKRNKNLRKDGALTPPFR